MKKVLVSIFGLTVLAGCATYDYYEGGVKYVQDGTDCIYYSGEQGRRFSNDIYSMDNGKKVVYRNTLCATLYNQDNLGQAPRRDRQVLAPAAVQTPCGCNSCGQPAVEAPVFGCKTCNAAAPVVTRKYYVVSGM